MQISWLVEENPKEKVPRYFIMRQATMSQFRFLIVNEDAC
jgi:hypothetical protein